MNVHENARLTPSGRALLAERIEAGWTTRSAARRCPRRTDPRRMAEILSSEGRQDATAFLQRATAWLARHGVAVERVMTDNGSAYRSRLFADALRQVGARHVRTRPYTPRTNGKAERFIQKTSLREWACARKYQSSERRAAELPFSLHRYNRHRPHGGIKLRTPISRLALDEDNLLRLHS